VKNHKKLYKIESIRGILALIIVGAHSRDISNSILVDNFFFKNGYLAVDFFFLISGFVITMRYHESINDIRSFFLFSIKRFFRLYPVHIITLFVWALIIFCKFIFIYFMENTLDHQVFDRNNFKSFFYNLFFLHTFLLPYPTFNFVSWSIAFEFYAYLLAAIVFSIFHKKYFFLKVIVLLISIISVVILNFDNFNSTNGIYGFSRCTFSFFWGAFLFLQFYNKGFFINKYLIYILFIFLILFIYNEVSTFFIVILFSIIFLYIVDNKNSFLILENKFLTQLGDISYGIFMYHMIIIWIMRQIYRFVFNVNFVYSPDGVRIFEFDKLNLLIQHGFLIALFVITLIISKISKKFIENLFINYAKKIRLKI
jgi:peptidoglycan/LPS O-acetylase OafA/YrhL